MIIFPEDHYVLRKLLGTRLGKDRRVAAVFLPSGVCGTDQGLPRGVITATLLSPSPVLVHVGAATSALGQSGHSSGGAGSCVSGKETQIWLR